MTSGQRLGPFQLAPGHNLRRLSLGQNRLGGTYLGRTLFDQQPGILDRDLCSLALGLGLMTRSLQLPDIQFGQRIAGCDKLALAYHNMRDPPWPRGGNVDLNRLDPPVSQCETVRNRLGTIATPDQESYRN